MARKKSVITMEHNGMLYYLLDNKGKCWSDNINDAKQYSGIAKVRFNNVKDNLREFVSLAINNQYQVYLKIGGGYNYNNPPHISYNNVDTITVHELFLHI